MSDFIPFIAGFILGVVFMFIALFLERRRFLRQNKRLTERLQRALADLEQAKRMPDLESTPTDFAFYTDSGDVSGLLEDA